MILKYVTQIKDKIGRCDARTQKRSALHSVACITNKGFSKQNTSRH